MDCFLAKQTEEIREMSEFAQWLLKACDRAGFSASQVSAKAGISRSYLHKIMNSHKPEYRYYISPSYGKTLSVGEAVGDVQGAMQAAGHGQEYEERTGKQQVVSAVIAGHVIDSIKVLFAGMDDPLSRIGQDVDMQQFSRLPLTAGKTSAGDEPFTAPGGEAEQFGNVLRGDHDVRAICVEGNCMEPFYQGGDILFVRRADTAENGNTVIAIYKSGSVICKVYRTTGGTGDSAYLESINSKCPNITENFRVVGIVKGSYRP